MDESMFDTGCSWVTAESWIISGYSGTHLQLIRPAWVAWHGLRIPSTRRSFQVAVDQPNWERSSRQVHISCSCDGEYGDQTSCRTAPSSLLLCCVVFVFTSFGQDVQQDQEGVQT